LAVRLVWWAFCIPWGRNLAYHPHIHYLIPAGGLAANTQTWLPARQDFLLPVKALSKIFRGKFRQALLKTAFFAQIRSKVWQQDWVVHCKPVGNGHTALKYLAPYVFRVAISNRCLVKLENDAELVPTVTFRYRATDTGEPKLCTLSAEAFIHRFLQHVLPNGFVKVRYFGFFAPGCRKRLAALRQRLEQEYPENLGESKATPELADPTPQPKLCCPSCGLPLLFQRTIQPTGRCPP
jgi:hypothetical protein